MITARGPLPTFRKYSRTPSSSVMYPSRVCMWPVYQGRPCGRIACYYESGGYRMGPVGVQEMVVILLVAFVLFGPKKLPELGKTIGKAMTEFRRAQAELKATFDSHMRELEKEGESIKE